MDLNKLLSYSVDSGASDLHLSVGSIPMVRINGTMQPLNMDPLKQEDVESILPQILDEDQLQTFEKNKEISDLKFALFMSLPVIFFLIFVVIYPLAYAFWMSLHKVSMFGGLKFKFIHCSNSGAVLNLEKSYFNMVRVGMLLYGALPSNEVIDNIGIKPVMSFCGSIVNVRKVKKIRQSVTEVYIRQGQIQI